MIYSISFTRKEMSDNDALRSITHDLLTIAATMKSAHDEVNHLLKVVQKKMQRICHHEWVMETGFERTFHICSICNAVK